MKIRLTIELDDAARRAIAQETGANKVKASREQCRDWLLHNVIEFALLELDLHSDPSTLSRGWWGN